jgi:predicted nucleic acid-binding protein
MEGSTWDVLVGVSEVEAQVPFYMRRYGLGSYDAAHVATAAFAGVSDKVTLDAHFAAVPAARLTLYTTSSRLSTCRGRRAR